MYSTKKKTSYPFIEQISLYDPLCPSVHVNIFAHLKGLFTNFDYITFFSCLHRNIFYKRSISMRQLWLEIVEKLGYSKSVRPNTVGYITRTDFDQPIFSIISSQSIFYPDGPIKKKILLLRHEKNVIYSKLVNNPFKFWVEFAWLGCGHGKFT